jgi:hypothetical protein
VNWPCCASYVAAFLSTAAFFRLMISDRMSVSSKRLAIKRSHPSLAPRLVDRGAHFVDDVRLVSHQAKEGRRFASRRRLRSILRGLVRDTLDQSQAFAQGQTPDCGDQVVNGGLRHCR